MFTSFVSAIIVGSVQVGPDLCQVDILVEQPKGKWEVYTEKNSCHVVEQAIKCLH